MKTIAIDAGHGHYTAGKRCSKALDPLQTREHDLNDRIADRVEAYLAAYDCRVLRTDDTTGAKDISLSARVKAANAAKADIFVSIHHNAGCKNTASGGTVVYYYGNVDRAAQAIRLYDHVTDRTGLVGNRRNITIKYVYYVLKKTNMPAFLLENGFMDSRTDTPIILTAEHADKTAQGIVAFLVETLSLKPKTAVNEPQTGSQTYPSYKGAKTTLSAALKAVGVDASFANRKKIAVANGISGYTGTASQNTRMYNLLVAGMLKRA